MDRKSNGIAGYGFTLVELMIVLVILAIVMTTVAPSMRNLLQANRLALESGRFLAALNLARSEAVMRNQPVSLCPFGVTEAGEPECSGTYENGWVVYTNPGRDKVIDTATDEVIQVFEGLAPGYRLTNRSGTKTAFELISFLPDGSSRSNRTFLFCAPRPALAPSRSIITNNVGRARLLRGRDQCPVA